MNRSTHIILNDGRRLTYKVHGASKGQPALLFHGVPGSRLQHPDPSIALKAGARIITMDRPGYGLSDELVGRSLLDWPQDVEQLADALGAKRFSVIGMSGGAAFALACAYKLGSRINRVAIASCPAPLEAPGVC